MRWALRDAAHYRDGEATPTSSSYDAASLSSLRSHAGSECTPEVVVAMINASVTQEIRRFE